MSQPIQLAEVPVSEPVTMINAFTVPRGESERFLRFWESRAQILAGMPGFIRSRMYRSLVNDAELGFINVAEWDSGKALAQARTNGAWRDSVQATLDDPQLRIIARPSVYQVAVEVHPAGAV